jgi:hypothetical protein
VRRLGAKGPWVLLLALVVAVAVAAGAFGYWGGGGTGTATAQLGDAEALSFSPGSSTAELYPGGTADVATVVSNPNPYSVRVGSLILYPDVAEPFVVDSAHSGCDVGALSFIPQDNEGAGWRIPARVGATDGTLAIDLVAALHMSAAAANACQGATFTVALEGIS